MQPIWDSQSPESELIVMCAHPAPDECQRQRMQDLCRSGMDWQRLFRVSLNQGVMPLLYHHLHSLDTGAVPDQPHQSLLRYFHLGIARNERYKREMMQIAGWLEKAGIRVIPLKGPLLAQLLYGDVSYRLVSDLDFMINAEDIPASIDLLGRQGYRLRDFKNMEQVDVNTVDFLALTDAQRQFHIDLKWGMVAKQEGRFFVTLGNRLNDFQRLTLDGIELYHHSWEDLLFVLSLHGYYHNWCRLVWLSDVAVLLNNHPEMDWTLLLSGTKRIGLSHLLMQALWSVRLVFHMNLPAIVERELANCHRSRFSAERSMQSLFIEMRSSAHQEERRNSLVKHLRHVELWDRRTDRWNYLVDVLRRHARPNIRDRQWLPLPQSLQCLYYLIRPIRLLLTYLTGIAARSHVKR